MQNIRQKIKQEKTEIYTPSKKKKITYKYYKTHGKTGKVGTDERDDAGGN